MIVINLFGEPGSGKSTTASGLFFLLKLNGYKVELVNEFAKELVWERRNSFFGDQISIFAEQNRRLERLKDHGLDYAISDSPLLLPILYKPEDYLKTFDPLVMEKFGTYENINYLLHRTASFEEVGRRHNEKEASFMAKKMRHFLDDHEIPYTSLEANPLTPKVIKEDLESRMDAPVEEIPFLHGATPSPT